MQSKSSIPNQLIAPLLIVLVIIYIGYPGQMSWDSFYAIREARTFVEGGSYPAFHAYLWRAFDYIYKGPLLIFVFETVVLVVSAFFILYLISKRYLISSLFLIAIVFIPFVLGPLLTVWKDVLAAAFLLALYLFTIVSINRGVDRMSFPIFVTFTVLATFVVASRVNAFPAVIPIAILFVSRIKKKKYGLCVAAISLPFVMGFLINSVNLNTLRFFKPTVPEVANPFIHVSAYDLNGISYLSGLDILSARSGKILVHASCAKVSFSYLHLADIFGAFERCKKDDVNDFMQNYSGFGLLTTWVSSILNHPYYYLKHRIAYFSHLIGFNNSHFQITQFNTPEANAINLPSKNLVATSDWQIGLMPSEINDSVGKYLRFFDNIEFVKFWVLFVFSTIAMLITVLIRKSNDLIALYFSAIFYSFTFLFLAVDAGVRYLLYPSISFSIILFLSLFFIVNRISGNLKRESK